MKFHEDKETASRFLSDLLTERERAEYERHLAECAECASEVERYRRMTALLRGLPQVKAPADFHASVMAKISPGATEAPRRISILHSWGFRAAAALLVLAVGAVLIFKLYAPSPERTVGPSGPEPENRNIAAAPQPEPKSMDSTQAVGFTQNNADKFKGGFFEGDTIYHRESPIATMPGGYDIGTFTLALNKVDSAASGLSFTQMQSLATEDQKAFIDFAVSNGSPEIEKAQLQNDADRALYLQMAQKRVIAKAFEKAAKVDEVAPIIANYNKVTTQQQYVARGDVQQAGRENQTHAMMEEQAPAAGAAPEAPAPQTADEEVKRETAKEAAAPQPAGKSDNQQAEAAPQVPEEGGQTEKAEEDAARMKDESDKLHALQGEAEGNRAEFEKSQTQEQRNLRQRFQRAVDHNGEVVLIFSQSLVLHAVAPEGEKRPLNETEKNDVKLVFDCLPTLENYRTEQFTPGGITVRLSEQEFLRLLQFLRDMADVRTEIGPIYADVVPASSVLQDDSRNEAASDDPYAVDVQIIFE